MRSVVSGRFVNGYSQNDMVLSVLYRYSKAIYDVISCMVYVATC